MENIQKLESRYLNAKIAYYDGKPIMEDHEFDALEKILKEAGSKVHEQVGSKRKDFDFPHPTRMLSLAKIQTEKNNDMYDEFYKWFSKRAGIVGKMGMLQASPKFDGSAINIIYRDGALENILTRGDGFYGKNITSRLKRHVPLKINEKGVVEIRCEVVIDVNIFEKKYSEEFANARNFVAGILGKDEEDNEKLNDLTLIPLHQIEDGVQVPVNEKMFADFPSVNTGWNTAFVFEDYSKIIRMFSDERKSLNFQLDGVVISFPTQVRADLGENDHEPEWSIAIKFVPEGAVTTVNGVEWNIGKRGQFTPVVLLDPVELAGTTVKRASGYNAGFLKENGIGVGAVVSIEKAGDIVPEIVNIITETTETFVLPSECPECKSKLKFDGIHLTCPNQECPGRIAKILAHGVGVLDLKGIGGERIKPFAKDFRNIIEVWLFSVMEPNALGKYGLEPGTRLHEIFVNSFLNIKSIPYEKVIQGLGYENVGKKLSIQIAKEHAGLEPDFTGLERALVDKLHDPMVVSTIKDAVKELEELGVTIDRPAAPKEDGSSFGVVLTGSPKAFGFATKKEFLDKYPNLFETSMNEAKYLITDDMNSTSGKMKAAAKKGVEIKTYGDF